MSDGTNREVVERIYSEWSRGEFSSVAWVHPDLVFIDGQGMEHRGIEGMRSAWRDFLSSWDEFRATAEEYLQRGDSVLALTRFSGRGKTSGLPAEVQLGACRFDFRDGLVIRLHATLGRDEALAAFQTPDGSLVGAWRLVEWTASDGSEMLHPSGEDATGRIIYSGDGYMSAFLARADGFTDALAYSGTWERRGEEVVHSVSLSTRDSFVGEDLVRTVSWEDGDLVLTTPESRDGWVNRLRWRREDA